MPSVLIADQGVLIQSLLLVWSRCDENRARLFAPCRTKSARGNMPAACPAGPAPSGPARRGSAFSEAHHLSFESPDPESARVTPDPLPLAGAEEHTRPVQ